VALFRRMAGLREPLWAAAERRQVWRRLNRYRPQLLAYGIDYERIPVPPRLGEAAPSPSSGRAEPGEGMVAPTRSAPRPAPPTPAPVAPLTARAVLGPGGLVARRLVGYEEREPQLQMVELVEQAIAERRHAVVEAGTGTGKSLGYLVPAILSGKRVIVSTANKALQEQLVGEDLPLLQRALPRRFSAALLKGRGNYLCRYRLEERRAQVQGGLLREQGLFASREAARLWPQLDAWARATRTGDLEQAPFVVPGDLRELVTVEADACLGGRCPLRGECFAELQRARAEEAQVVVVNHALLLRDLELRHASDGEAALLPDADVLVLDEAHALEDVAADALGARVDAGRWGRLARRLEALSTRHPAVQRAAEQSEERDRAAQWMQKASAVGARLEALLAAVRARLDESRATTLRLGDERALARPALEALAAFAEDLEVSRPGWLQEEQRESWAQLVGQIARLAEDLERITSPGDEEALVRFATLGGVGRERWLTLQVEPIDVSGALRERLFPTFTTVIATSATLATAGGFGYWRSRVGLDAAEELVLESPFDFARHALLYLPADGAALDPGRYARPRDPRYLDRLAEELLLLLEASDGRAFCLFSSFSALEEVYARLRPRLRWLVLKQGELSRAELLRQFKERGPAVLFGVKSFWEGVDVRGEALSLVAIDKLPFPPPDDPVWAARCAAVNHRREDSRAWFTELALPFATLQLKQGFGRLIRTRVDRGVVALLDGRLSTRSYGAWILDALPPATRTRSVDAVRAFFAAGAG